MQAARVQLEGQLLAFQNKQIFEPPVPRHEYAFVPVVPFIMVGQFHLHRIAPFVKTIETAGIVAGNARAYARKIAASGLQAQAYAAVRQGMAILQPRHVMDGTQMKIAHVCGSLC